MTYSGNTATIAFALALTLGPFVAFRAYARRVGSTEASAEDRLHRIDRVRQAGGFVLPVLAVIGLYSHASRHPPIADRLEAVREGEDGGRSPAASAG